MPPQCLLQPCFVRLVRPFALFPARRQRGACPYLLLDDRPRDLVFRPRTFDLPEVLTHLLFGRRSAVFMVAPHSHPSGYSTGSQGSPFSLLPDSGQRIRSQVLWIARCSKRVAVRLRYSETRLLCRTSRFTCKSQQNREPTSGLEPLTCSLRVIGQGLQGVAEACKSRISRRLPLLRVAECCTVLRSRWYQSGINRGIYASRSCSVVAFT